MIKAQQCSLNTADILGSQFNTKHYWDWGSVVRRVVCPVPTCTLPLETESSYNTSQFKNALESGYMHLCIHHVTILQSMVKLGFLYRNLHKCMIFLCVITGMHFIEWPVKEHGHALQLYPTPASLMKHLDPELTCVWPIHLSRTFCCSICYECSFQNTPPSQYTCHVVHCFTLVCKTLLGFPQLPGTHPRLAHAHPPLN